MLAIGHMKTCYAICILKKIRIFRFQYGIFLRQYTFLRADKSKIKFWLDSIFFLTVHQSWIGPILRYVTIEKLTGPTFYGLALTYTLLMLDITMIAGKLSFGEGRAVQLHVKKHQNLFHETKDSNLSKNCQKIIARICGPQWKFTIITLNVVVSLVKTRTGGKTSK